MSRKLIISQESFTAGEISPRLYGRIQTQEYERGVESLVNAVIEPQGPVKRRNGSQFIAEVKDSSDGAKLVRYQFSQDTAFILEFGDQYIRFFKDSGQVTESNITITGITQANPAVITATGHGLSDGDHIYITSVVGMTELNKTTVPYKVSNSTSNTFELQTTDGTNVDSTAYTAYSSGGTINRIYEISSPYTISQVDNIQYVQNGATLYIAHPDVSPRTLKRITDTNWTLSELEFLPPVTYESGYDYNATTALSATTGIDKEAWVGVVDLTDATPTYQWTASGSGTNEYYVELNGGGDPSISTPTIVIENLVRMTEGTVGSLSAGEYDYGDNDTLGYSTIYVRLTDGTDPDTKSAQYVMYSEADILLDGDEGRQIINEATGETGRASITDVINGATATIDIVEDFTDTTIIGAGDTKLDLSPVVDLEFDSTQAGAVANIRSEYTSGSLGPRLDITNVTKASTGVVTSNGHGLSDGDKVQIQDIQGMSQINNKEFTVDGTTANTFQLKGENTSGYTTYSSGGIVRKVLTDISKDAFRSADEGKYILANGGVLEILTVNSATDVDALIHKSLNSTDTTGNWTLEEASWTASRGYPRSVGLYEQRLVFGGTTTQPQTLWFSEIGIFDGFGIGPDDEDSIEIDLVSNQVNEINWIASSRDLVVGTSGGELTINSGSSSSISPSSIQQQPRTYHGSKVQQVFAIKDEILFIQGSERKIRTFRYDFNIDGYTGESLTFLAEHITEGGLEELVYAQEPDTVVYAVTTGGDLLAGTYDRSKQVIGWGKFTTDGYYERVQTITKNENDQIWTIVKREIDGSTKRYIELFAEGNGEDDLDGFSDSYLTLDENKAITGITNANPAVITSTSHGLSDGDLIIIKDLVDPLESDLDASKTNMSTLNGGIYTVANKTSNTFELSDVDTSNYNSYGSSGNVWERVTSVSGLDHLEGKIVQVKGDGSTQANKTVTNGAVTLDTAAGQIILGLPYTTTIKTLTHRFDIGLGSMQGQRGRWARPLLLVNKSGRPLLNGEFLPARSGADEMGQKVPLYSGFLEYGALNWDNTTALTITLSDPLPLQLTNITGAIQGGVK